MHLLVLLSVLVLLDLTPPDAAIVFFGCCCCEEARLRAWLTLLLPSRTLSQRASSCRFRTHNPGEVSKSALHIGQLIPFVMQSWTQSPHTLEWQHGKINVGLSNKSKHRGHSRCGFDTDSSASPSSIPVPWLERDSNVAFAFVAQNKKSSTVRLR